MDSTTIILSSVIALMIAGFLAFLFWQQRKNVSATSTNEVSANNTLKLQAYERLTLLADRIALPNIISRLNQADVSAREMQMILTQNIRQEFEYNITQQIYVSAEAWNAVKNLKDQNMLLINQLASSLPANATGMDLNKHILQFLMNDKRGTMHEVVSEVLSYEAKKLL